MTNASLMEASIRARPTGLPCNGKRREPRDRDRMGIVTKSQVFHQAPSTRRFPRGSKDCAFEYFPIRESKHVDKDKNWVVSFVSCFMGGKMAFSSFNLTQGPRFRWPNWSPWLVAVLTHLLRFCVFYLLTHKQHCLLRKSHIRSKNVPIVRSKSVLRYSIPGRLMGGLHSIFPKSHRHDLYKGKGKNHPSSPYQLTSLPLLDKFEVLLLLHPPTTLQDQANI